MIYVIVGPTGSGKTSAANDIALRKNAPIISGDAFQVYKEMNVGTNKISDVDLMYHYHRMIDIITPDKTYSVMEYQVDARKILDEYLANNRDVVICGGTGLYIKALLFDYEFLKEDKADISDLENLNDDELHEILKSLDAKEAEKIHKNNRKRVLRAIELIRNSGISKSELLAKQEHKLIYDNVQFMFLCPDRETLYKNINDRVIDMINHGLVKEVEGLLKKYDLSLTARQGIGYKEIIAYLNNEMTLEEAVTLIQKRTRNYAKRQITFFKHQFPAMKTYNNKEELLQDIE